MTRLGLGLLAPAAAAWGAALLVLLVLYLLRPRRPERRVGSLLLFRRAATALRAERRLARLERSLLLLLQALAIVVAVLALMRPVRLVPGTPARTAVLVVDATASMGAIEPGATRRSRLQAAVAAAKQTVLALPAGGRAALVVFGARPRVRVPLTASRAELLRALATLSPTDAPGRIDEALALARSLTRGTPGASIHVYTDGVLPPPARRLGAGEARLEVVRVGQTGENVGLVTLAARRLAPAGGDFELFVAVENFGRLERRGDLVLLRDGQPFATRPLALGPRGSPAARAAFALPAGPGPARVEARLDLTAPDALAADDRARIVLPRPGALRVALVTTGGSNAPYLERALASDPQLKVTTSHRLDEDTATRADRPGGARLARLPPDPPDVLVHVGPFPRSWPAERPVLLVPPLEGEPGQPHGFGTLGPEPAAPARTSGWQRQHPVLRFVDLRATYVARAQKLRPAKAARTLWQSSAGPLLLSLEERGVRRLLFTFHPLASDLPLQVAYPVLVLSAVRWLAGDEAGGLEGIVHRTGEAARVSAPAGARRAQVTSPDGRTRSLAVSGRELGLGRLETAGFHQVRYAGRLTGEREQVLAVSLLDRAESDIAPRPLSLGPKPGPAAARTPAAAPSRSGGRPLWRLPALAAVLLLFVEWVLFRRGLARRQKQAP